mmetsp:Transcript_32631/g.56700  ORF Transcript_32631/g.56700 Transcript_32631/m.56700 type:complete len:284 (-) Transcript_32631:1206-2057(-)
MPPLRVAVKEFEAGMRLCQFALSRTMMPWSAIQKLIRKKHIWVETPEGPIRSQEYKLKEEDKVCFPPNIILGSDQKQAHDPAVFKQWIISEDEDHVAINKPAGLACQGGISVKVGLDTFATSYNRNLRLMHRIDRETSGLVLLGKSREATSIPITNKKYYAVVKGQPSPSEGVIDAALDWNYCRGFLCEEGKEAITHYTTLASHNDNSLVEFRLFTGRKHQIRIHSKYFLKTPIIGDSNYGGQPNDFMLLHSSEASVQEKRFKAKLPNYIRDFCPELWRGIQE